MVQVAESGKWSMTRYRLLSKLTGSMGDFSLLEARPITGRTHQIRVHCQYAGHVIAGDAKYGNEQVNQSLRQVGLQRLFLHASMLRLEDPSNGQPIKVRAPMDEQLLGIVRYFQSSTIDLTNIGKVLHGSVSS
jgi:23S rRNA pseudouridine955/2504/2580 synthase